MQEDGKLKLEKNGAIVAYTPCWAPKTFEKTRTTQSEELNFYIPEKWDYNQEI